MSIGVVIPCFIKHIDKCLELLDSINEQTILPVKVVVSCSSSKPTDFPLKTYKFHLQVVISEYRLNAAQNRNIAASLLDTDIISFIDADDTMHPKRLEGIVQAMQDADIVLHNFLTDDAPFQSIINFTIDNKLSQCFSGCIKHETGKRIMHSQVSVKKNIFEMVRFSEKAEHEAKEDCVFCYQVFSLSNVRHAYIHEPLSKYISSGTMDKA